MSDSRTLRRLHQHHVWASQAIMSIAKSLQAEELHYTFPIGQGSVWRTVCHLVAADYLWLESLLGDAEAIFPGDLPGALPGNQQGSQPFQDLEELAGYWENLHERWLTYLANVPSDFDTAKAFRKSSSSYAGMIIGVPASDVVLHVFMHASYTRAQIMNMFRQLKVQPLPDLMLITLARTEAIEQSR